MSIRISDLNEVTSLQNDDYVAVDGDTSGTRKFKATDLGYNISSDIAQAYSASSTYSIGEYCLYENVLYRCNTTISSAEAWNASHWTQVNVGDELYNKVDKVSGKGLSTNDFTDALKTKLEGIETGAEVNDVNSVAGKTGAVTLDADDVAYDSTDTYSAGTVGKGLTELKADKADKTEKADVIISSASGSIASFSDGADDIPMKSVVCEIEPVQSGSGDPSPTNVRPISGWTGMNVTRCGKNIFDEDGVNWKEGYFIDSSGIETELGAYHYTQNYIPVKANTTYSCRIKRNNINVAMSIPFYTNEKNFISRTVAISPDDLSVIAGTFTTPSNCSYIRVNAGALSTQIQIEEGSTATDYEAYNGNTYAIDWTSEAGTVYGGSLDVTTGVLTVDYSSVDLGSLDWYYASSIEHFYTSSIRGTAKNTESSTEKIPNLCSQYVTTYYGDFTTSGMVTYYQNAIRIKDFSYTDAASFKTAMAGVQYVYKLATPLTYQLTATEINSLLGSNNLWCDTGDSEVEYRADTKLYIDGLTEPDSDMVADANIASGSYFIVNNKLYLATTAIAQGADIIVGTNCNETNLAEALNALNA